MRTGIVASAHVETGGAAPTTAPTLQAEGTIAAVTTGNLTVTNSAHAVDDILVLTAIYWGPNSLNANVPTPPAGWTLVHDAVLSDGTNTDGWWAVYWKRATSAAETNPVVGLNSLDTGSDMCFAGRVYTIRNVKNTGTPYDDAAESALYGNVSNQLMPAIAVAGVKRTAIQFYLSSFDQNPGLAPTGWTAGTVAVTSTGTNAGFQTYRQVDVSANIAAQASTTPGTTGGRYWYVGVSFIGV